jgi:long-subunit acyl-CoA synthetase (AMP-forming)
MGQRQSPVGRADSRAWVGVMGGAASAYAGQATALAIDTDGWLHTGDVARIDEQAPLTIVDRKKELIINSAGNDTSPTNIEAELNSASPLIGRACCIRNDRPYTVALLVLGPEVAASCPDEAAWAAEVKRGVEAANSRLACIEQIKRYTILDAERLWAATSPPRR